MIKASSLRGRPVVDLDAAQKIGDVAEIVLDPDGRRIAALIVSRGPALFGGGETVVPASSVHAVGPDAITVTGADAGRPVADGLPRLSQVTGRKMVTHGGAVLGAIDDVLVDARSGRILGYAFDREAKGPLDNLFGGKRDAEELDYVQADFDLRVGPSLIVVPDDAVVRGGATQRLEHVTSTGPAPVVEWSDPEREASSSGAWTPSTVSSAEPPPTETSSGDVSEEASRINSTLEAPAERVERIERVEPGPEAPPAPPDGRDADETVVIRSGSDPGRADAR